MNVIILVVAVDKILIDFVFVVFRNKKLAAMERAVENAKGSKAIRIEEMGETLKEYRAQVQNPSTPLYQRKQRLTELVRIQFTCTHYILCLY